MNKEKNGKLPLTIVDYSHLKNRENRFRGGDQSYLRTQKGGSLKTLEGFRGGTTQICLENEDIGGGGVAKVIKCYQGDHLSEVTFKGRIG